MVVGSFVLISVTSNILSHSLDSVEFQYMLVYCDMNAVRMDTDGTVGPVPLCPGGMRADGAQRKTF